MVITLGYKRAHRYSWELHRGPIPKGMLVCHSCDTPTCVNPEHLFLGTPRENSKDMKVKGRAGAGIYQPRGSQYPQSKLRENDIPKIRSLHRRGLLIKDIAEQFSVDPSVISRILSGHIWTHA
jgi:hypothetical protein